MPTATTYEHIVVDDQGVPHIAGTTMKVIQIARDHLGSRWDAEQIVIQYPHLSRPQVHSALAYYFEHRDELDRDIERRRQFVEGFFAKQEDSTLTRKLAAAKAAAQAVEEEEARGMVAGNGSAATAEPRRAAPAAVAGRRR